jgi:hypothetical protein
MYTPCLLTYFDGFSVYLILGTQVLNWSISRNHKEIWNSTKISVTLGMYVTWDSVQRPLTSGLGGGQLAGQLLSQFRPKLPAHVSTREGKGNGGGESWWRRNSLPDQPRG